MTCAGPSPGPSDLDDPLFRLRANVVPLRYDLEFFPSPQLSMFTAKAAILFEVKEPLAEPAGHLVMHARKLQCETSAVSFYPVEDGTADGGDREWYKSCPMGQSPFTVPAGAEATAVPCVRASCHADTSETCCFTFAKDLPNRRGERFVVLVSRYVGRIFSHTDSCGLFHCSLRDAAVLATHLEPTDARQLFPCYDEPCFQSVFCVAIVADAAYTVISSTVVEREEPVDLPASSLPLGAVGERQRRRQSQMMPNASGEWRRTVFQPTPPIHSCIVAFATGQFQMVEQQARRRGVLCRVIFPTDQPQHAGWFALDLLTKALDFFEDFFDYPLPLQKLDLVALEEFGSLGMENWGMITILMKFLLVTETTTLEVRQRITRLIGHEVCHHWFGNWASVAYWPYLWLKEGMCRYLEYCFTDAVYPSWCMWNDFVGNIVDSALVADADPAAVHAAQYCDRRPRHILGSFDSISYAKGAALLRMLFTIIDIRTLKKAANLLMRRHGNDCFDIAQFASAIHAGVDEMQAVLPGCSTQSSRARRCPASRTLPEEEEERTTAAETPTEGAKEEDVERGKEKEDVGTGERDLHALVDCVLALAQVPGHPYILVEQIATRPPHSPCPAQPHHERHPDGGTTYRISQFPMPLLHRGILPYFVRQQRQRHGPAVIDLLTPPVSTSFEWDPAQVLRGFPDGGAFRLPIRVLELTSLHCSALGGGGLSSTASVNNSYTFNAAPGRMYSANPSGGHALVSTVHTILLEAPTQCFTATSFPTPACLRAAAANGSAGGCSSELSEEATPVPSHSPAFGKPPGADNGDGEAGAAPDTEPPPSSLAAAAVSHRHFYFNYGGSGAFRCDYDIATWQRVFELAPYLKDDDRMTVTTTLARLRNVNIGHFPHESAGSDRCTLLLEWLMVLTQSPALMNASLWGFLTKRVEELVYMTQNAYCGRIFRDFVSSLYLPLHQRCLLSFLPQERTTAFQSHLHLSRSTVASIMHVLVLCGSPLVLQECQEVATWALHAVYPSESFSFSINATDEGNNGVAARDEGMGSPSDPHTYPLSSATPVGTSSSIGVGRSLTEPMQASSSSPMAASAPRPHASVPASSPSGAPHVDFANDAHNAAVTDALQYLVQRGELDVWRAAAGITAALTQTDVESVERELGIHIPSLPSRFSVAADMPKLSAMLPAFFSLDNEKAFEFMADVLERFTSLSARNVKALLRNTRFLTYLLESRRSAVSERLLYDLIVDGAVLCSNGHAITLFKAAALLQERARHGLDSHGARCSSPVAESSAASSNLSSSQGSLSAASSVYTEYRAIDFMDDGVGGQEEAHTRCDRGESARGGTEDRLEPNIESPVLPRHAPRKRKLLSPALAAAFDVMECNCVWMDYCSDHFERFLREQRSRWVWLPCESQMDSRCTPLAAHLEGSVGSLPMTTAPDGSLSYQGPVGGISI